MLTEGGGLGYDPGMGTLTRQLSHIIDLRGGRSQTSNVLDPWGRNVLGVSVFGDG